MDISEAKKISIVDYLENMGYTHAKIRRGQYWYRSPLREEKTPSFVVNNNLHEPKSLSMLKSKYFDHYF